MFHSCPGHGGSGLRGIIASRPDPATVRPDLILRTIPYTHPLFTVGAVRAQKELPALNRNGILWFCGSYFKYGFHEDAFTSALELCRGLTGEPLWI